MSEEQEVAQGHIHALMSTVTAIIRTLPPEQAAEIARNLAASEMEQVTADEESGDVPPAEARARTSLVNGFLDLLAATYKHG
ncbi:MULTISPECIES: hypothetical protein [Delftia]|jgi:hypothetical protein|uniref:hypothetical protein n=1 Tax=Delftia TaxID=80865 RepID=UPI000DB77094|nr:MULTISPECIES: hypothetical protein [Delftia]MXN31025.1 hypothetical protein [Delftia sp. CH05]PZP60024.1 MAG: hypothetical protein DI604_31695 [Delftia acidovorans]WEL99666.1 hypothetical protein PW274_05120 [Delftia tsuruhatensis]WQM82168.1 hypothetical protein RNT40_26245 [Delftia tsuruhatensis]